MNITWEFQRYLRILLSWAWLIMLGALLAGGANYYIASKAPPRYQASITLMVGQFIKQATPDQSEVNITDRLAFYYQELLHRQPVLEGVKQELQINLPDEEIAGKVATRVVPSTAFIEISVVDLDPTRAVKLVNAFAHQLIKQSPTAPENQRQEQRDFIQKQLDDIQAKIEQGRKGLEELNQQLNNGSTAAELTETRGKIKALETQIDSWQTNYTSLLRQSGASSPNSLDILEESTQARRVQTLSPVISAAIAGAIGAGLALGFAIFLEYLDDRLKSSNDIKSRLKLPVLGHIPVYKKKKIKGKKQKAARSETPFFQEEAVQAYELLSTSILFSEPFEHSRKSLMLTAPQALDEQAMLALNLAISIVSFEQSVLLIDANTRAPQLHKVLGVENKPGFYEVFYGSGYISLEDKVQETEVTNLYLMTAGECSPEAQKIIVMRPGTQQIYGLPHRSLPGEFVIFNCDSILSDKTARLLTSHITGTILLCVLNQTRTQEMKAMIEVVQRLKGTVLGVVTLDPVKRGIFPLFRSSRKSKAQAIVEEKEEDVAVA